jgi:hypothetical protein
VKWAAPLLALLASSTLARAWYDPGVQRWINRDPVGTRGGINLHTYVMNMPINMFDDFGLSPGHGNPVSGPSGPVGPSDPYAPGGAQYCPSKPCDAHCRCEIFGGAWTQNNGYSSWQQCMDNNWRSNPPSTGPAPPHAGLPGGSAPWTFLSWQLKRAICSHSGCSLNPSHYWPGS